VTRKPSGNIRILHRWSGVSGTPATARPGGLGPRWPAPLLLAIFCWAPVSLATEKLPSLSAPSASEKQLEVLARDLRGKNSTAAYNRMSAWARRPAAGELGLRAALALGYFDYTKARYAQARAWLEKAQRDSLLREYALYWSAEVARAQGRNEVALNSLESFRREFPDSVMTEPALEGLADAALAAAQPQRALAALEAYPKTHLKPTLLFLEARAQEQNAQPAAAAVSYQAVYNQYPLAPEAAEAGLKARALQRSLGEKFPAAALADQIVRAEILYEAHHWKEARGAYVELLPHLAAADRERGELRFARCEVEMGASPITLAQLTVTDPQLDAERLYDLAEAYRSRKQESEMAAAIEHAVARDPQGPWAEAALFTGGNFYWVNLDSDRAADYYRRLLEKFPTARDATPAHWRLAWIAYRARRPEAPAMLAEHLRRFPGSPFTVDALYWLGRAAERDGAIGRASAFYRKAAERFPQTYFGRLAAGRLTKLDPAPIGTEEVLSLIPPPPAVAVLAAELPLAASDRWKRAQALRSIAFDSSAELELRAAYTVTGAPMLVFEAAQAATDAEHYMAAASEVRQIFPQLEARRFDEAPPEIWRLVYPLPFGREIRQATAKARIDAMLVAGLIRQESGFQAEAVSHMGAIGLMQLEPKTAQKMARQARVRYSRAKLLEPGYNLRLGTLYLADLVRGLGGLEAALAAYNAGEDRVAAWHAGRNFDEPAEFVESIPFTETREYVEVVSRNAEIYRHFYGDSR
jgi:soluble lytic murein transglycosylase